MGRMGEIFLGVRWGGICEGSSDDCGVFGEGDEVRGYSLDGCSQENANLGIQV